MLRWPQHLDCLGEPCKEAKPCQEQGDASSCLVVGGFNSLWPAWQQYGNANLQSSSGPLVVQAVGDGGSGRGDGLDKGRTIKTSVD